MELPNEIQKTFYEILTGEGNILDFESWLYAEKHLENFINSDDYLELISLNYKNSSAKYELIKILERLTDKAEFEKWWLLNLLNRALKRDTELPQILMTFYDLYCKGYSFFDNLGIGFGLAVEVPYSLADSWGELSAAQQENLLSSFYPQLTEEIYKVIGWLENKTIIVTGNKDSYNHYFDFVDNRTSLEKMPTAYKIA